MLNQPCIPAIKKNLSCDASYLLIVYGGICMFLRTFIPCFNSTIEAWRRKEGEGISIVALTELWLWKMK